MRTIVAEVRSPGRLVSLRRTLDGLYSAPAGAVRGAVQLLHGNVMNYCFGHLRTLVPGSLEAGYTRLADNRRGRDTPRKKLTERAHVRGMEWSRMLARGKAERVMTGPTADAAH